MKEIEKNAFIMAKKLKDHPLIYDVYHPALSHTINHDIWKRDFTGSSGLFSFSLNKKATLDPSFRIFSRSLGTNFSKLDLVSL